MKVLIVEDEQPAAEKLRLAIQASSKDVEILSILSSVKETVIWLNENPAPELIFMDIQVADGLSFKIFEQKNISCPVIFVTAYDEYWQKSFEYNGIDYLLKPVRQEKLEAALLKYKKLQHHFSTDYKQLLYHREPDNKGEFKKRLLVKKGLDYFSLKTEEIAYFFAAHKVVFLVDRQGQKFVLDKSLSEIEKELDPRLFYRVNRKYLVNLNAISRIKSYSKSKLLVEVMPELEEEIVISPENAGAFKTWLGN